MKRIENNIPTLIKRPEVERRTGLSTSSLYKLIAEDKFPRQVSLNSRSVAWSEDAVTNWIYNRIADAKEGA